MCKEKTERQRVVVVVSEGCAEIVEEPADIQVIVIDRDGDCPFYCEMCESHWGPQDWDDWDDTAHPDWADGETFDDKYLLACMECVAARTVPASTKAGAQ